MQMLHPHRGAIQQYLQQLSDPDPYRPDSCPQCQAGCALRAHSFILPPMDREPSLWNK